MRQRLLVAAVLLFLSLPSLAAITGTVMSTDGAALGGARVSIYTIEGTDAGRMRLLSSSPERVAIASVHTDAKGVFSFESPKEAVVDLRVDARGYEPHQRRIEKDEEVGAVALAKVETKKGSVRAAGKPVANATVVIAYGSGSEYLVKTDEQGRYEAPDPKRARSITVVHPDYGVSEEGFMTASTSSLQRTLVVGVPVAGKVVGADGQTPVAKATVYVDGWPMATTGDDGTFSIPHVLPTWTALTAQSGSLIGTRAQSKDPNITIKLARAATVTGRITDAKTKLPIAGVQINLGPRGPRMQGTSAVTDAKGTYSLTLAPGTYFAIATHPGYDMRPNDVSVSAGSQTKDMSLTPLARVSGVVVDEERKPVAAAVLASENAGDAMGAMMVMRMMRGTVAASGPDGRFSMRVEVDTDLKLRAARKGLPAARSDAFRLGPGERKTGVVLTIPRGIAVTGKVTDKDGNALSGVAVSASEAVSSGPRGMVQRMILLGGMGGSDDEVRTGSDGTYSLRVKEGTYDFSFRREGYSTKLVRGRSVTNSGENVIETTLDPSVEIMGRVTRGGMGLEGVGIFSFGEGDTVSTVTAPDGSFTLTGLTPGPIRVSLRKENDFIQDTRNLTAPARDVNIELPVGERISGRVIDKSTRKPLSSFQAGISTSRSGGAMVMMAPPQLKSFTADDGSFVLENVPPGAVNLVAQAPGYATSRMNLHLEEGKPITGVEVELETGVKLTGKVTGPDGAALSGATVRLGPMGGGGIMVGGMGKTATTDESGEYTIDSLDPGDVTFEFSHPKYLTARKDVQLKGREVKLDAQLSGGQKVSGVVVTEAGVPVGDAEVTARASAGSFRSARTDANGAFSFDSLSPARYNFSATRQGYAEGIVEDFDVATGAPVRIVLKSGGILYGQVRGLSADELASATVEARSGASSSSAPVDSTGNYRLEGAPLGTVRVSAMVSRSLTGRRTSSVQTVEVTPGSAQQLDLEFRSDTVVRGRVMRDGKPLSGGNISFFPRRGGTQSSASVPVDEAGSYSISGLEEGEYNVTVFDMQRFSPYSTTYEVRGSATFDINYQTNTLRGRVVDSATGDPINEARVQLRGAQEEMRMTRGAATDAAGTFALDSVAAGNYVITVDRDGYGNHVENITVTDRSVEPMEIKLSRNESVTLQVVDARDGRSLTPFVFVYDAGGRLVYESPFRFGAEGGDLKLALSPGMYTATVSSMDYAPRTVSFRSPSPAPQRVALSPGGTLVVRSKSSHRERVRLIDASGVPYPRFGNRPPGMELNPSPGTSTFEHLAPGTYTLQLLGSSDAIVVSSQQVTVVEGGTVETEI